ncbi:branched-chain amino acid ABC transporter permease [Acidiferrimicrobium sp. IK]|uniref:branched-chain amino acid ABC transporter permease n=1 Tax=Acidiferrimicrobium sp. IK TaxID=2871700 RepID=UPI0021CB0BCC|nr:branched-chain amino acid ABC transporter permease [Acidiferrimicrobium sp. IK]MCU4187246.1 branched-chain amino acid ABC transporter permease [Acidiferrimicrobium sp. IK]
MNSMLSSLGFGIVTASILLPAAVGFTLQFSATGVLNIAFGAQMTFAAYIAFICTQAGMSIWLALVLGAVFGAVFSALLNRFLLARFAKRGTTFFGMVVVTIALALLIEYLVEIIWGTMSVNYQMTGTGVVHLGAMSFTHSQLVVMAIGLGIAVATHSLLKYTRIGKAIRAVASNTDLARSSGVPAQRITDIAWLISGLMGGAAGVMLGISLSSVSYTMGDTFLIEIIAAAVLGGVGQVYGAMLGALAIGVLLEESAIVLGGAYAPISAFAVLILVLLVRPTGIMAGAAEAKGIA